jgi:hypothetical protein
MAPTPILAPPLLATPTCKSKLYMIFQSVDADPVRRFHLYGPHGPTLLSNGPSSVEIQGRWIKDAIKAANKQGLKYISATEEASKAWKQRINELGDATLFPTTRSTYMGGTVPGKKVEMVCHVDTIISLELSTDLFASQTCYAGGVGAYNAEIRGKLTGWQGFETVKA